MGILIFLACIALLIYITKTTLEVITLYYNLNDSRTNTKRERNYNKPKAKHRPRDSNDIYRKNERPKKYYSDDIFDLLDDEEEKENKIATYHKRKKVI